MSGSVLESAETAWQLAVEGDTAAAYRAMVELADARPDQPDAPLRLYWLLAVDPTLDPARTRHAWLAEGLVRAQLGGPAAELYRRELAADPAAATKGSCERLLTADAPPGNLLTLARWRLAAADAGLWHVPAADLDRLAGRLRSADETGWLNYVAALLGRVAWERNEPLYSRCREELAGLQHLRRLAGHVFDRLDELEAFAARWRDAYLWDEWPAELLDAVRAGWAGGDGPPRRMAAAVRALASDPAAALAQLGRLHDSANRPVLLAFGQQLTEFARTLPTGPAYPPGVLRALGREFLTRHPAVPYPRLRDPLLSFLIGEVIDPLELADACAADADPASRALAEGVRADVLLRWVWLAVRLHGG